MLVDGTLRVERAQGPEFVREIDEARQALTDLRHDSFENGLPGALLDLVQAVSREKGVQITLEQTGDSFHRRTQRTAHFCWSLEKQSAMR